MLSRGGRAHRNSTDLCLVLTAFAFVSLVTQVSHAHEATQVADVSPVRIGHLKEPLSQELSGSMRYLTISFHLSEPQSSVSDKHRHHG